VDGETYSETSTQPSGEVIGERGEDLGGSGWTTTKQAAKVLGVSRRSVQGYVRQGILEARDEGEGVNKRFLVSIDSLNALSARRKREAGTRANFAEAAAGWEERAKLAANADEGLRHLIARLEARTEEATELRIRLELTEKAQSTLEDDLAEERRRREEAEREREDLRRKLEALRERPRGTGTVEEAPERAQPRSAAGEAQEAVQRPWWRRVFGS
jgi:chromosome segregation ATPase